jgi:hypothetical protein
METVNTSQKTFLNTQVQLPVFPGFYESLFDPQYVEAHANEILVDDEHPEEWDMTPEIVKKYKQLVGQAVTSQMELRVNDFLSTEFSFQFVEIWSPREYNYTTDKVFVDVHFEQTDFDKLVQYLHKNKEKFEQYVKETFTSCSGFISFHSNDVNVWFDEYIPSILAVEDCFYLYPLFEFVCENERYNGYSLYDDVEILNIFMDSFV